MISEVIILNRILTIAEVLWLRRAPRITKDKAEIVQKFFRRSYIRVRNVTREVSESAQLLVWDRDIKPKDAIHVATALDARAVALETFDRGLITKSGTVGTSPLIIRQPDPPEQGALDLRE